MILDLIYIYYANRLSFWIQWKIAFDEVFEFSWVLKKSSTSLINSSWLDYLYVDSFLIWCSLFNQAKYQQSKSKSNKHITFSKNFSIFNFNSFYPQYSIPYIKENWEYVESKAFFSFILLPTKNISKISNSKNINELENISLCQNENSFYFRFCWDFLIFNFIITHVWFVCVCV